jgi:hypothetical protein
MKNQHIALAILYNSRVNHWTLNPMLGAWMAFNHSFQWSVHQKNKEGKWIGGISPSLRTL